jgi:hypothetical protein
LWANSAMMRRICSIPGVEPQTASSPGGRAIATPTEPISTRRRTACGRAVAIDIAIAPPIELPTMSTVPIPRVSSRARAWSVQAVRP